MLNKSDIDQIRTVVGEEVRKEVATAKKDLVDKKMFTGFKDKILNLLDKVMGELKTIREEQTVISGYKDQIEDHDTRINKLEEVLQPQ